MVFVVTSWRDSYGNSPYAGFYVGPNWAAKMDEDLRIILAREGVVVLVCYHSKAKAEAKADIAGWFAYEHGFEVPVRRKVNGRRVFGYERPQEPLVHYFYTKGLYRREGVWTLLMRKAGISHADKIYTTCKTEVLKSLPIGYFKFNSRIARHPKRKESNDKESSSEETDTLAGGRVRRRRHVQSKGR